MDIRTCILVGAGGTGSHLAEPLARLLQYHPNGLRDSTQGMLVVDGDKFDHGNHARQLGTDVGKYKSEVMAERLASVVPGLRAIPLSTYVDRISFRRLVLDGLRYQDKGAQDIPMLAVLAVDNHTTRRDCYQALHELAPRNALILSPGNDEAHGQCLAWGRVDGKDVTPYPLATTPDGQAFHPEILHPPEGDHRPGGCHAAVAGGKQRVTANATAALATLLLVEAWLNDEPIYDELRFECTSKRDGNPRRKLGLRGCGDPVPIH